MVSGAAAQGRSTDRFLEARQTVRIQVREDACVEWLPLENIVFDGALASWRTRVDLAAGAAWIGAELVCLGRPASEERFERGALRWRTEIYRDGRLLFHEQALLRGGDRLLESPAGLGGAPAYGSLLAVAPRALADDAALLGALRAIDAPGEIAVTALPDLVAVRWRGAQAQDGWRALRAAWALLRPEVCGRVACSPRIWNT
ncbi:MAG: urease accessory protein UreD [Burkholderiaceae bacterium]